MQSSRWNCEQLQGEILDGRFSFSIDKKVIIDDSWINIGKMGSFFVISVGGKTGDIKSYRR
jgi:hypothetical protein